MAYCTTKQYMKYIAVGGVALAVNKEIEKGAKVILMVPFLQTDAWGSRTVGYNVLFEKEEEYTTQLSPEQYTSLTEDKLFKIIRRHYGIEKEKCCFISVHDLNKPETPNYIATDWGRKENRDA